MTAPTPEPEDEQCRFRWGPLVVQRWGTFALQIKTDAAERIDVYVDPTGRRVRVFSNGKEWTPVTASSSDTLATGWTDEERKAIHHASRFSDAMDREEAVEEAIDKAEQILAAREAAAHKEGRAEGVFLREAIVRHNERLAAEIERLRAERDEARAKLAEVRAGVSCEATP